MGRPVPGSPIRAILEALALVFVALVVSIVAGVAFAVPLLVLGYDLAATPGVVALLVAGQFGLLLVGGGYVRWRGVPVTLAVPDRRDLATIAGGAVGAIALAVVLSVVLAALDLVPDSVIGEVATDDPTFLLALAGLSVVLIAPAEELLFRGAVQGRLRQRFGAVGAVAGSSLLFGAMHLANYAGAVAPIVAGALLIATVGVVLGAVYEYADNLVVPVAVHAVYNVVLLVAAYLAA